MKKYKDCKTFKDIINLTEYKNFEFISYILLMLWSIAPIIEYILKNFIKVGHTMYYEFIILIIGVIGIINYTGYFIKQNMENKLTHKQRLKKYFPIILILIMFILAIISTIFAKDKHIAIYGENYRKEGLLVYLFYIGFIFTSSILKNKKYIFNIINTILISAAFIVIIPMFDEQTLLNLYKGRIISNIFFQFNHYGYFLMICSALALFMFINENKIYKKIIYITLYIILLLNLILNDTFGCILAFIITLICLVIYSINYKWKITNVIVGALVFIILSCTVNNYYNQNIMFENFKGLFLDTKTVVNFMGEKKELEEEKLDNEILSDKDYYYLNNIGTSRGILWRYAIKQTLEHPIVGGGIESLNNYYYINHIDQDRPHNIVLQISSFIGIPGAIIYIVLILYLAIKNMLLLKNKNIINLVIFFTAMCYFISSLFGNSMFYTSPYFMILLGLLISFIFEKKTDFENKN